MSDHTTTPTDVQAALEDVSANGNHKVPPPSGASALLGEPHTGMRISASGVLGRIRDGRYYKGLDYGCGVMLDHLEQMAARFYAGDPKAVDEFLQLYCLDDARPQTPNAGQTP